MAKWGEGDPRWIVEERADATNVNNWHWTEKNATGWSKDKLRSLLEGLKIEDDDYCCEIKEVTSLDGEASANNRKAKLIFFYEWVIKATWEGYLKGSEASFKGKLSIPNLSDENDADEVDVEVTADTDKDDTAYKVKEYLRLNGVGKIRHQVSTYIKELKEEFSQGMILPAKEGTTNSKTSTNTSKSTNIHKEVISQPVSTSSERSLGVKIHCKKIKDKETFKCQAGDIYRALTEKEMVRAFTRGDATIDAEPGGQFSMFGGNISGEIKTLEPFTLIKMRWRYKTWPDEHYSDVTIKLDEKEDCTELSLTQTGVPESDHERTRQGWRDHYWEAIKQTFGFGVRLF